MLSLNSENFEYFVVYKNSTKTNWYKIENFWQSTKLFADAL